MADQIIIKNLLLRGTIGLNDWERDIQQDILVNITLTCKDQVGAEDNLDNSINYRTISKKVIAYVETNKPFTVEYLADQIARMCLQEDHCLRVKVQVEKPGAVRFAESVGVIVERVKHG
jgi:FolB domain-containing protein